jgi:hypothetical protein
VVAQGGSDRDGLLPQQVGEEIEIVDRVGLGHACVGARPLEPREAAGAVTDAADGPGGQPLAQHRGHRMEAEDVPNLQDPTRLRDDRGEPPALGERPRQRLLDEAVPAGAEALAGHRQVIVGGGDDVDRVHVRERLPEIPDRAVGGHPGPDRECPPLRRDVGRP